MLTLPTIIGLVWLIVSFICLFLIPFLILLYMIKRKYDWLRIILIQILAWISIFFFIHLIYGGFWFFIGIIGPTLSMG